MTRSASPGAPLRADANEIDRGSASSGSRSSKLAICGRMGTAILRRAPGFEGRAVERERILRRQEPRFGKVGNEPQSLPSGRSFDSAMPSAKSVGSPRNLLTMKPRMSLASSAPITALVPARLAITPPPSMSPMRTTGASAARAKPILAMSLARRFTRRASALPPERYRRRPSGRETLHHERHQVGLHALIFGGGGAPWTRPCTTICAPTSLCGLSRTGFMCTLGGTRAARA